MADRWEITNADNATLTLVVTVNDVATPLVVALDDLDASNERNLLDALRDLATRYREERAVKSPPLVVGALVGSTEEF